ncbi:hypothetical protein GCM10009848_24010 [Micromonospora lupini]|uniref:Uncharacterized protein n=1 Tax=Micromonospora lupini str. Lupac 08 TaxID=1150864 RepID=I0LC79_9ACTN|nr:hypothetical protein MILUP08_46324 [Micromonospora lupini str. Lupac 08]
MPIAGDEAGRDPAGECETVADPFRFDLDGCGRYSFPLCPGVPGQLVRALDPESGRRHDKPEIRGGAIRVPVTENPVRLRKRPHRDRELGDTPDRGCRDLRKVALVGM